MKSAHEEIKEFLPEYLHNSPGAESRADIALHLKECEDCKAELQLLAELEGCAVPDPGEIFWKGLPAKVLADYKAETAGGVSLRALFRPFFFPFPVAATVVLFALLVFSLLKGKDASVSEVSSSDPLAYRYPDYSDIDADELLLLPAGDPAAEEYLSGLDYGGQSYLREVVSLDPEELASLYEILGSEGKGGRI